MRVLPTSWLTWRVRCIPVTQSLDAQVWASRFMGQWHVGPYHTMWQ